MKGKTTYGEIVVYSVIVLLLIALSVCGYHDGQESKANAGIAPNIMGIAVDYWAQEPTEVRPPLLGFIASGIPYRAMAKRVTPIYCPLLGEDFCGLVESCCKDRDSREGYIGRVVYFKGGNSSMIRWLYWPAPATPPEPVYDTLLLQGATYPEEANGYYDRVGEYGGKPQYRHRVDNYGIVYSEGAWNVRRYVLWEETPIYFQKSGTIIGSYDNNAGEGTVTVSTP